jgi:glycosyltransferase involved in cell wall biosynthesis
MPRLTVIMPAKNAARTIRLSLASTIKALPADAEIVVWDDGSHDATASVAESMGDSRIRVVQSPVSVGGGLARRAVMDQTDSKYVASMDADDYCLPWRFRVQMPALAYADISFGGAVRFWEGRAKLRPTSPLPLSADESRLALLVHNPFFHPSMLGHRDAIDKSGGYTDQKVAQDYDLWLRIAATGGRVVRSGIPTIGYRQSDTQVSQSLDYEKRVSGDLSLRKSYVSLIRSVVGDLPGLSDTELGTEVPKAELRRELASRLTDFRGGTRHYYRRLISQPRAFVLAH